MARVQIEDLVPGNVIWQVTVTVERHYSYLKCMLILETPFLEENTKSLFCKFKIVDELYHYKSEFSLLDANITPNTYNQHAAFTTLKEAQDYLAKFN